MDNNIKVISRSKIKWDDKYQHFLVFKKKDDNDDDNNKII